MRRKHWWLVAVLVLALLVVVTWVYFENTLAILCIGLVTIAPAILLLLLRRWSRRWWVAIVGTVIATPPAAFFAVGGVAWTLTYWHVVDRGDTAVPDENGMSVQQYLGYIFALCGAYGVLFAGMGFGLSVPVVSLWRLAHASSFNRFTRSGSAPNASGSRQRQEAEPGATANCGQ